MLGKRGDAVFELRAGTNGAWVAARVGQVEVFALRPVFEAEATSEALISPIAGGAVCEWQTALGAVRLKVTFPPGGERTVRCTLSLLPIRELRWKAARRDLAIAPGAEGCVHTMQRGLRSGIFFAGLKAPHDCSLFYFQDFSTLGEFFEETGGSPSATVGGDLREAGYLPPVGDACILPQARELVLSDAYLAIERGAVQTDAEAAARYLDAFADVYQSLERPSPEYHDWPERAGRALRDLTLSPECTYERGGGRFLMPYVADRSKPPESMVQLTVLVNTLEYERWRGEASALSSTLLGGIARFYDPEIGSIVRWLPGEEFAAQSEEHMDHESMDSWYLYHALFNMGRLASLGDAVARELFVKSLPFAVRVARRFDYRWPIFFDLRTLDIVRAESSPGKGGENDVAGLYALVMLHAHDLLGDALYFAEAQRAAQALRGMGFRVGYQMNTTGFAAEAMLRLWKATSDPQYLELGEICMAGLFDNMWLWRCDYGRARDYRTFFGMFPLHDAPYLAAYEELEAQAKFNVYLELGGRDVRPSLQLLLAEYQKFTLDRAWFYYPDALPLAALADDVRNGRIERALSVPLEDLQDGRSASGSVGQEIYGSGLAFVLASRHYVRLPEQNALVFCQYPLYDVRSTGAAFKFRTGGDARGACELRIIPLDADREAPAASVRAAAGSSRAAIDGKRTVEGHLAFALDGGSAHEVRFVRRKKKAGARRAA